jgi:hypothetical protein
MNPCDRWRYVLAEYALGSRVEPGLAEHLEKCSSCSAALAKLRTLTREIDGGIRQLAAVEPDAGGAGRILAEVRSRAEGSRWWQPTGRTVSAALVAVIFLAPSLGLFWRVRVHREDEEKALSAAAAISSWKSPTQELLRAPYASVLDGSPRLGKTFYPIERADLKSKNSTPRAKEKPTQ